LDYGLRAITLSREAYQAVAKDAYMTGPALLISLIGHILQSLNSQGRLDVLNILVRYGVWFLAVLILYFAARLLRGKADYPETLRVAGFAQSAHILELLGFIPVVGSIARFIALVLTFFGVWIGSATAHEIKGWRAFLLPVLYVITLVVTIFFLEAVIEGSVLAVEELLADFGLAPRP
jgi:hypothetical protein